MRTSRSVESRRDRMELATEAGYPKVSLASVLAGVLVAYGAFAVLAALAGGVLNGIGLDTESLTTNDWREYGVATGAAAAVSLFLAYLFGGYVAGRMARRAGVLNGALVFVFGILLAAGVAAAIGTQSDGDALADNLRSIGVPTSGDEFGAIGTFAGLAAIVSMLLGSLFGGVAGERWHGKLVARALDPTVGPGHADAVVEDRKDRTDEVDGGTGRHFTSDANTDDDRTRTAERSVDITEEPKKFDDDVTPERTRTLR